MIGAADSVALWVEGDSVTDWDVDARPAGMDDADYAGADVPAG